MYICIRMPIQLITQAESTHINTGQTSADRAEVVSTLDWGLPRRPDDWRIICGGGRRVGDCSWGSKFGVEASSRQKNKKDSEGSWPALIRGGNNNVEQWPSEICKLPITKHRWPAHKGRALIQLPVNPCARYGGLIRCLGGLVRRLESLKSKFRRPSLTYPSGVWRWIFKANLPSLLFICTASPRTVPLAVKKKDPEQPQRASGVMRGSSWHAWIVCSRRKYGYINRGIVFKLVEIGVLRMASRILNPLILPSFYCMCSWQLFRVDTIYYNAYKAS